MDQAIKVFELECQAMHYDWGKKGKSSLVAQLMPGFSNSNIKENLPYAELWMGVHPKGPSKVKTGNGELLSHFLEKNPALLGQYTAQRWGNLPFLFKVLSIAEPLSIQLHPDKSLAERLHNHAPEHYPDSNHKPEVALAVSDVEMLYGWETPSFLSQLGQDLPPLTKAIKKAPSELKHFLSSLFQLQEKERKDLLQEIACILGKKEIQTAQEQKFLSIYPRFPQDLGLIFTLLMQRLQLSPGTEIYIKPNNLHAYLFGDLVECMANSDNVVRAGMTHKFVDVDTLLQSLSYQQEPPHLYYGTQISPYIRNYHVGAEEFELYDFQLPVGKKLFHQNQNSPEILLVLSGSGVLEIGNTGEQNFPLEKGRVLFIGARQDYHLKSNQTLHLVLATVPQF